MFARQYLIGNGIYAQREISDDLADELAGFVSISQAPFPNARMWDDELQDPHFPDPNADPIALLVAHMTDFEKAKFVAFVQSLPNIR